MSRADRCRYRETAMAKIFRVSARAGMTRIVEPIARALLRSGVSPNTVTVVGTTGVIVGAVGFGPAATSWQGR